MKPAPPRFRSFVFENDPLICNLVACTLEDRGHEVFSFSTAIECPLWESEKCPCPSGHACTDIMIADNHMPQASGLDFVAHQVKRECKCSHYAILSGSWTEEEAGRAHEMGCFMIRKPFEISTLEKWIDRVEKEIDPGRKLCNWFLEKFP